VESFLNNVDRLINRLPRLRDQRARREREQEEWRAQLHERIEQEQHERRQWREQQEKFDQLTNDVEQWGKAECVRAYAAAAEAHLSKDGPIEVGSQVDGWLRWMHWYADHLDPMTSPEPQQSQDRRRIEAELAARNVNSGSDAEPLQPAGKLAHRIVDLQDSAV
jgi:hypothetical protein